MAHDKNVALQPGTTLRGKVYTYTIEEELGQGAFGITYLATIMVQGPLGEIPTQVTVKEFFVKELDTRLSDGTVSVRTEDGISYRYAKAFLRESENLAKMKLPGIVNVLEAFEANGTYYYSMEYLPGGSLDDKVRGAGMPENEALPLILKIGDSLSFMHSHRMMHLDLKPKNIMLKANGTPVIIDFGLSKQYDGNGEPESSSTVGLGTPGYAPLEQANQSTDQTFQPTLDVYALGATLYKMLTGDTPPNASSILDDGLPESKLRAKGVSATTISAIRKALHPMRKNRPQSVDAFLSLLQRDVHDDTESTEEETTRITPTKTTEAEPVSRPFSTSDSGARTDTDDQKPRTWLWVLLGFVATSILAIIFVFGRNVAFVKNGSGSIVERPPIPSDFVLVPGGHLSFSQFGVDHLADLDSFYICKYELTQGEYRRVKGELKKENYTWHHSVYLDEGEQFIEVPGDSIPIRGSYLEFAEYCNARSISEGYDGFYVIDSVSVRLRPDGNGYRLATPYEWILAAYGGNVDRSVKFLGGDNLNDVAWHLGNSQSKPHPVGQKKPNSIGLFDMQGNAREVLQGDDKRDLYFSMLGCYNVSNWSYIQAYNPTYICVCSFEELTTSTYGTRIVLVPKDINNDNLLIRYAYEY